MTEQRPAPATIRREQAYYCEHRRKEGNRCAAKLFDYVAPGSTVSRTCHKCGKTTTITAKQQAA